MAGTLDIQTRVGRYVVRNADLSDVVAVIDVRNKSNQFDFGSGGMSEEELKTEWEVRGLELVRSVWIAESPDGQVVGYGEADLTSSSGELWTLMWLLPEHRGIGLEEYLIAQQVKYVSGRGQRATDLTLIGRASSNNESGQLAYTGAGYNDYLSFQVMQIDLNEMPSDVEWPEGVTTRPFVPGRDEQTTYKTDEEASEDKGYHAPMSFTEWSKRMGINNLDFDPDIWFLAWSGAEVAGVALNIFDAKSGVGWVDHLGVRRDWRRCGLGKALLLHSFRELYRRGAKTIKLSVDSGSLTNAPRLYESAGMRTVQMYHIYRKSLAGG